MSSVEKETKVAAKTVQKPGVKKEAPVKAVPETKDLPVKSEKSLPAKSAEKALKPAVIKETKEASTPVKAEEKKPEAVKKEAPAAKKEAPAKKEPAVKKEAAKKEAPAAKKTAAKKETPATKKAPAKKETTTKKTAARKEAPAKEGEAAINLYIQGFGKEVSQKDIIERVKEDWAAQGNSIRSIKTLDTYIKPEEGRIYYVINGEPAGSIEF